MLGQANPLMTLTRYATVEVLTWAKLVRNTSGDLGERIG
jgi:hypothetical protein